MSNPSTSSALKPKLTFELMIEHLEEKQVKFNHTSKEEARIILENSNYFYKITAFRKNFEKNNKT
ncbi:hypothetical protein E2L07_20485 [Halalkalibacterium halodurans]|uniref:hypothetical protein n=1 Tax=Halalkalibacterium halodurans TaxID=86665 RepID=UPI0010686505|nr:hypothetical protein [Halalkalibacterium halodurans]TES45501.1 hypothetical protein E2L07_20485 [Halalkalibacterium halodurans]